MDGCILQMGHLRFGDDWIAQTHKMGLRNDLGAGGQGIWNLLNIYLVYGRPLTRYFIHTTHLILQCSKNSEGHILPDSQMKSFWNSEIMWLIELRTEARNVWLQHSSSCSLAQHSWRDVGCAWSQGKWTQCSEHNIDTLLLFVIWNLWASTQDKLKCT